MRKNTVQSDRSQMAIQLVRFTYWVAKDIDIYLEYVILLVFTRQTGYGNALQCYVMLTLPVLL